ncbi:MAG: hypothetical protein M3Y22_16920, partial [Pseudomonadota bacterium]|nr:hypothetical protein [Pseudomonadota bacterium]
MASEIEKGADEPTVVTTAKPPRRKSELAPVGKMRDERQAELEADAQKLTNHQLGGVTRLWADQTEEQCLDMV